MKFLMEGWRGFLKENSSMEEGYKTVWRDSEGGTSRILFKHLLLPSFSKFLAGHTIVFFGRSNPILLMTEDGSFIDENMEEVSVDPNHWVVCLYGSDVRNTSDKFQSLLADFDIYTERRLVYVPSLFMGPDRKLRKDGEIFLIERHEAVYGARVDIRGDVTIYNNPSEMWK